MAKQNMSAYIWNTYIYIIVNEHTRTVSHEINKIKEEMTKEHVIMGHGHDDFHDPNMQINTAWVSDIAYLRIELESF